MTNVAATVGLFSLVVIVIAVGLSSLLITAVDR